MNKVENWENYIIKSLVTSVLFRVLLWWFNHGGNDELSISEWEKQEMHTRILVEISLEKWTLRISKRK
jgi:hypothetical protein